MKFGRYLRHGQLRPEEKGSDLLLAYGTEAAIASQALIRHAPLM